MEKTDKEKIEKLTRFLKIIGDSNRLKIIWVIGKGERSVSEIINETGLAQTLVSFHLKVLRESDVVKTERKGAFIYYSLMNPNLVDILSSFGEYLCNSTDEVESMFPWPCPPWLNKKS